MSKPILKIRGQKTGENEYSADPIVLFVNDKKVEGDNQPELNGHAMIGGEKIAIGGFIHTSEKGTFVSLSGSKKVGDGYEKLKVGKLNPNNSKNFNGMFVDLEDKIKLDGATPTTQGKMFINVQDGISADMHKKLGFTGDYVSSTPKTTESDGPGM